MIRSPLCFGGELSDKHSSNSHTQSALACNETLYTGKVMVVLAAIYRPLRIIDQVYV